LAARLAEHEKSIGKATNLDVVNFECRYLVVSSGWQEAAESHLIGVYKPVWNWETKICFGIGKHGDAAKTRSNKRSPWDTMHAGRGWAKETAEDQQSEKQIREQLANHFATYMPFATREEAITVFLKEMCQSG